MWPLEADVNGDPKERPEVTSGRDMRTPLGSETASRWKGTASLHSRVVAPIQTNTVRIAGVSHRPRGQCGLKSSAYSSFFRSVENAPVPSGRRGFGDRGEGRSDRLLSSVGDVYSVGQTPQLAGAAVWGQRHLTAGINRLHVPSPTASGLSSAVSKNGARGRRKAGL